MHVNDRKKTFNIYKYNFKRFKIVKLYDKNIVCVCVGRHEVLKFKEISFKGNELGLTPFFPPQLVPGKKKSLCKSFFFCLS